MADSRTGLTVDMISAVRSKVIFPVLLCRVDTMGGPIYLWSGFGELTWEGQVFQGIGDFGGIDRVEETHDLTATSMVLSLSGVEPTNLEIALNEIQQKGRAYVWFGALTVSGSLIADPYQLFSGITDVPELVEGESECTIKITCESRLADLGRSKVFYYTPEDQKLRDPVDKGFDFVAGLQNASIIFG